jgi:NADPH:quinone reductase-like Zn-dependent oxidoreductase
MKAVVVAEGGSVEVRDVPKPVLSEPGKVLIKVETAAQNPTDCKSPFERELYSIVDCTHQL